MSDSPSSFQGTKRFVIRRQLGAGGMGVVYEAYDRNRDQIVALKTLRHVEASAIYRFKNEFRALAEVAHPNLVSLYELVADGDHWFFTMELVHGAHFLDYVLGPIHPEPAQGLDIHDQQLLSNPDDPATSLSGAKTTSVSDIAQEEIYERVSFEDPGSLDHPTIVNPFATPNSSVFLNRLRSASRQLAEGVHVLHQMGKLHRDIKPSNVLVTKEARVVLLDFGLITELTPEGPTQSIHLFGTPAYMSPEQAAGVTLSEASDWYSVGVMLYEALTRRLPFTGQILEVLERKQSVEPVAPSKLVPSVPEDLDLLCRNLLHRDPRSRPSGKEVLHCLGLISSDPPVYAGSTPHTMRSAPFIGREPHLITLMDAFLESKGGHLASVFVHGSSGIGKSSLVNHFLSQLRQREEAVVLTGRCYERESVPYKALDSVIDALSRYMKRLPRSTAEAFLPRDILALARLFPVLQRVDAIAGARRPVLEIKDFQELRRRAFAALRELMARLADHRPFVLFLDDLQWGDADSAALLNEILRPPNPPALLLIACYRSEEAETSPLLRMLLPMLTTPDSGTYVRELAIRELSPSETRELTLALLGETSPSSKAEAIITESGGSPFFIDELVQYSRVSPVSATQFKAGEIEQFGSAESGDITLSKVIQMRASQLSGIARRLLEVVAVAGQPLDLQVVKQAAGISTDGHDALAILRSQHLVRTRQTSAREEIEPYHDRIRETIVRHLPPEMLRMYHYKLALELERSSRSDPEILLIHLQGAGESRRAAHYANLAAAQASEALAFDRAARLYRLALELQPAEESRRNDLHMKLGDALADAGRGAEAAQAYLDGAIGLSPVAALEFQRRAAEQLLISGHIDRGLEAIRTVLQAVGLKLAKTPRHALVSLLLRRIQLRLRGLSFQVRQATQLSTETLTRIDICWSAAVGLALVDNIRAASFQSQNLLLALRAGEPHRIARALAVEAGFLGTGGPRTERRTGRILRIAETLAQSINSPHAMGLCSLTAGVAEYYRGHWQSARELVESSERMFLDNCSGVAWELTTARLYQVVSLFYQGELAELYRRVHLFLKEAQERGNLYAATVFRTGFANMAWLMKDDADAARRVLLDALKQWSREGFHVEHYLSMQAEGQINLYTGEVIAGWKRFTELYSALESSMLLRIQNIRIGMLHLRARIALAASGVTGGEELLRSVERDTDKIERERLAWSNGLAQLLRAGLAARRGERLRAIAILNVAEHLLGANGMALYAAAARYRKGELLKVGGASIIASETNWMIRQEIKNPLRIAALLAPGFENS
jgi:serine/threonine protein kinase